MSGLGNDFLSRYGRYLYGLLPSIYRETDDTETGVYGEPIKPGTLARYLDSFGILLDSIKGTLEQRLADSFPDNPQSGAACQDWLIPYFAKLLDVKLVSPNVRGQREEVAKAILWRQCKGTLPCIERISESVLQGECEIQEGWRRIASTARIGWPLFPASAYGDSGTYRPQFVSEMSRHPGLPAVTPDFRFTSRAFSSEAVGLATNVSRFAGVPCRWMQANPHGVPDFPGGFDDVSLKTVDFRPGIGGRGLSHPRRLLLYSKLPYGLFPPPEKTVEIADIANSPFLFLDSDETMLVLRNASDRSVIIDGDLDIEAMPLSDGTRESIRMPDGGWRTVVIEGVRIKGTITLSHGRLILKRTIAGKVQVLEQRYDSDSPVFEAYDSLAGDIDVPKGYSKMERCTILGDAVCGALIASNSIFAAKLTNGSGAAPFSGSLKYCCLPPEFRDISKPALPEGIPIVVEDTCVYAQAGFFESPEWKNNKSPDRAAAVLAPNCPEAIVFGGTDGQEIGFYHDGREGSPVIVAGPQSIGIALGTDEAVPYVLRDLVFTDTLEIKVDFKEPLVLERVTVSELTVQTEAVSNDGIAVPVLDMKCSVCGSVNVTNGLARLQYCTVLIKGNFAEIQASDCIFAGEFSCNGPGGPPTQKDCLRYCRLPASILAKANDCGASHACTAERAYFFEDEFTEATAGGPGGAVLRPDCPVAVREGAEDGGEMGAYHDARHCLLREAVRDKIGEHVSVGMEAVLIPDRRLHIEPPRTPA